MQDLDFEFLAFTAAKHWHGLTQGEVGSAVSCNTDLVFTKKILQSSYKCKQLPSYARLICNPSGQLTVLTLCLYEWNVSLETVKRLKKDDIQPNCTTYVF